MNASKKPLAQQRHLTTEVLLDTGALDSSTYAKWKAFVEFGAWTLGVDVTVGSFTGMPPDDQSDFAYVTDSSALSRKLLLNVPRIYIQAESAPIRVDPYIYWKSVEFYRKESWRPVSHSVTLISSVFRGDEFLPGFLYNCRELLGYQDFEHFLIRSGSPGNEHERLVEHVRRCSSAIYLNLAEDPGLYEVWNLGVRLATSRYISNANIDDRRAPEQVAHLKGVLDSRPDVSVVSTALRISKKRNLTWEASEDCEVWFGDTGDLCVGTEGLFEEKEGELVSRNFPHCMPLWRRSLHAHTEEFDEKSYGPSADWAFWVHAGMRGALFHLSTQPMGLYLRDEESYWRRDVLHRQNDQKIVNEFRSWASQGKETDYRQLPLPEARPMSLELTGLIDLFRVGAVHEGIGRLLRLAKDSDRMGATEHDVLHRVAEHFLGCKNFSVILSELPNTMLKGKLFDIFTYTAWVELIMSLDSFSERVCRTLELACIDLSECSGGLRGLLLWALLARKQDNRKFEDVLVTYLSDIERDIFYKTMLPLR